MESTTAKNKAFILEMIGQKKKLQDYPDKASEEMVVREPSSLPFGGVYKGLDSLEEFYPEVRKFYDFSKFELQQVYGDGDHVFAIIKAGIANTNDTLLLCEHITFDNSKIVEVQLFIYDYPERSIHTIINS